MRLFAEANQCENVEERADGAGNEDGRKEVDHNAPGAGYKERKEISYMEDLN